MTSDDNEDLISSLEGGGGVGATNSHDASISNLVEESWKVVENGALGIGGDDENDLRSLAVASRFGGSIRGGRPRAGSISIPPSPMVTERSSLLDHKKQSKTGPPPLFKWIGVALLCAMCYALYNISIKKGSASIHPILGGVILQFVAAMLGSLLLGIMILRGNGDKIHCDRVGLWWSVGAGIWVGTAEIVSFVVSGLGVPATSSIPIIIGGSVVFGSVLGVALLGEVVMMHGWSGVLMLCIGIGMVATDPGEKVEEGGGGGGDDSAPPLLVWIGPALFCALSYALYNVCIKLGSASINPIAGAVVLQFVAAAFGSCILAFIYFSGTKPEYDDDGVFWAFWAGIFVGGAELLSFCVSGLGVPASQSIPVLIGGSVGFGAVLGILMLGEELELQGWTGVVILMIGIGFVATDPGEKMEGH